MPLSTSAHLPGPWHVARLGTSRTFQLSPLHGRVLGPVAVEMDARNLSDSCADATARLIEAAPVMLDALRAVLGHAEWLARAHYGEDYCHDAVKAARAAIAKANGNA